MVKPELIPAGAEHLHVTMTAGMAGSQQTISVNGRLVSAAGFPVHATLLDLLRDNGLTGAKEGCAEGECGACTVVLVEPHGCGCAYRPVNSCLLFAPAAIGRQVYTVEALSQNGRLAEVQQAIATAGGSQCGYCTPGFVMSLFAEQYRPGRTGSCNPQALSGNLCRCTGYRPIRDAVLSIGPAPDGALLERLSFPADPLPRVDFTSHQIRFERPTNLDECLWSLAGSPEAKLVSGSTDLAVESNLRLRRWPHLIELDGIPELRAFAETSESVTIGAALPLADLARLWTDAPAAVYKWIEQFASPLIRNRATLGGNLATASPVGDSAPLLIALNASLVLTSRDGDRHMPLSDFYTSYRQTRLAAGELIRVIEIPKPLPAITGFFKATKRRADDISIVSAGLSLTFDPAGHIDRATFAFGGVGPVTQRAPSAEHTVIGRLWNQETVDAIGQQLDRELHPIDDHRGSAGYRLALARNFIAKFHQETT